MVLYCQSEFTTKSVLSKNAAFYHPLYDQKLVNGLWIGEVYNPKGLTLNLTDGPGLFSMYDTSNSNLYQRFKGKTVNGIWDGYIYYHEQTKEGNLFLEGEFKGGLPHGKIICCLDDNRFLAGTFHYGYSYNKISLYKTPEPVSLFCNGFDFLKFIKNDSSQLINCARETSLDDPLYACAIIISRLASFSEKHPSIDKFLECMRLNEVEPLLQSPEYSKAGADVIQFIMNNQFWKDFSLEEIQELCKVKLKDNHYENLSESLQFVSFLSCLMEECRKW